ncbi:MAG: phage head-tail adapter protein [Oscillospiraceae bacterium]|jgi:sugar lactone lactonase YvrE|nr:phage head-tail adapter protein [Oscillospiraceae bacterium]
MRETKLFATLPEAYVCTPDGMAIDRAGNLILSCPNYADDAMSGCVLRIDKERYIAKWFDVPPHPETGLARNMGIAFDEDWNIYLCDNQGWSGNPAMVNKGRILRLTVTEAGEITDFRVVAYGMEHPNGIRIRGGFLYVTQSSMEKVKDPSGKLVSAVYRFALTDQNIAVSNTLDDKNLLATFLTHNPACQYGVDGIDFDAQGRLYVGNFGDGEVIRLVLSESGEVLTQTSFAKNPAQLTSTDGMFFDEAGNLYIADFSANALAKVTPDGQVERIAQSPDTDGLHGELDQPGEPIVWEGMLIASCFDLVTDAGKVNTAHEMPATMAYLALD